MGTTPRKADNEWSNARGTCSRMISDLVSDWGRARGTCSRAIGVPAAAWSAPRGTCSRLIGEPAKGEDETLVPFGE